MIPERVFSTEFTLGGEQKLTTTMRRAHSVDEVMELTDHPKAPKKLELIHWSSVSKLLLKSADARAVQRCLNHKVDNVSCAADAVLRTQLNEPGAVQASDELTIVAGSVIPNKAVEFVFKVVLLGNTSHNLALREAGVVAVKVAKGYEDVPLLIVNILINRLTLVFLTLVFVWGQLNYR